MRRDHLYLADIVEAADSVAQFVAGVEESQFVGNDLLRSAVLHKLIVIGEAAARISDQLRTLYSGVPWSEIVAFRNIAIHAYFSVEWPVVWTTAAQDVPALRSQIAELLRVEEAGDSQ